MVISEFSNVLLRKSFKQWSGISQNVGKDFKKDYVGTSDYKSNVETILILIKKILSLPNVVKAPDNLNAIDINNIEQNFQIADFNDSYFIELARLSNYKIVTNDRDFQKMNGNMQIITTQI
jgi:predicted nucleic acid-binding protein